VIRSRKIRHRVTRQTGERSRSAPISERRRPFGGAVKACWLALSLLAACGMWPFGTDLLISFDLGVIDGWAFEDFAVVSADRGRIIVQGAATIPDRCNALEVDGLDRSGESIELVLQIVDRSEPGYQCPDQVLRWHYTAAIGVLSPGVYSLRVRYTYPGSGWTDRTVFDGPVPVAGPP